MKTRFTLVGLLLVGLGRSIVACVGDDPTPAAPEGSDSGQPDGTSGGDGGGPDTSSGDTGSTTDAGDAADAFDADDGAPKCPTSIPTLPLGPHCPNNPNGTDQCPSGTYCCSADAGTKCNTTGSVCTDNGSAIPQWSCEADTRCGTGQVCGASIKQRTDAGCPLEFDVPLDQGSANCGSFSSFPSTYKFLCDPNGGTGCTTGTCKPAIIHFPNTTKTFVLGVCSP